MQGVDGEGAKGVAQQASLWQLPRPPAPDQRSRRLIYPVSAVCVGNLIV